MASEIKFISFSKKKTSPEMEKLLSNISKRYNVNNTQAMEYFNLMTNDQRTEIFTMYDHGSQ